MSNEILKSLLEVANTKKNADDLVGGFKTAVASLKDLKVSVLTQINTKLVTLTESVTKDIEDTKGQLTSKVDAALKEQEAGLNFMRDKARNLTQPKDGKDGVDGKDAPPVDETKIVASVLALIPPDVEETGDQIIDKINAADNLISAAAITGLEDELARLGKAAAKSGKTPGWGAHPLTIEALGVKVAENARFINFSTNLSVSVNSDGVVTVSATGGSGLTELVATGTINSSNTAFTFVSKPKYVLVDGTKYKENAGWTWNAGSLTATTTKAPDFSCWGEA